MLLGRNTILYSLLLPALLTVLAALFYPWYVLWCLSCVKLLWYLPEALMFLVVPSSNLGLTRADLIY